jgi:Spy/CpxP family protein refolding chaperone
MEIPYSHRLKIKTTTMKKLFFLLALVASTYSVQAQVVDSFPWFKLDRISLELGERIGTFSDGQFASMKAAVSPILQRSRGQQMTKQLQTKMRQDVRKAIVGVLTPAQRSQLKATRKGERDALDRAMTGKSGGGHKRQ